MQIQMIPIGAEVKLGDPIKTMAVLGDAIRDQVSEGVRYMTTYPPLSGSSYRRTGTLRHSWFFETKSGGGRIEGSVKSNANIAPYNAAVQGENQLDVFRNIGWRTVKDLEAKINLEFHKRCQDLVDKYMETK